MPEMDDEEGLRQLALPYLRTSPGSRVKQRLVTQTEFEAQSKALTAAHEEVNAALEAKHAAEARWRQERTFMVLKLRLVIHHWRGLRRQLARQQLLLRELNLQRNEDLSIGANCMCTRACQADSRV